MEAKCSGSDSAWNKPVAEWFWDMHFFYYAIRLPLQTYGLKNVIVYSYGISLVVCQKLAKLVNICSNYEFFVSKLYLIIPNFPVKTDEGIF